MIFAIYIIKVMHYREKHENEKQMQRSHPKYVEYAWERFMLIFLGCLCMQFFPWLQLCESQNFPAGALGALGIIVLYTAILVRVLRAFLYTIPDRDHSPPRFLEKNKKKEVYDTILLDLAKRLTYW